MHGERGASVVKGVCVVVGGMHSFGGGACIEYDQIRSMCGRYASYWNAILLKVKVTNACIFKLDLVLRNDKIPERRFLQIQFDT